MTALYQTKKNYIPNILLVYMFFISDDTITFGSTDSENFVIFKYAACLMLILAIPIITKRVILASKNIKYLYFIILSIVLTSAINSDLTGGYVYQIWIVSLAFLISELVEIDDFAVKYNKILFTLSVMSLIIFIVANSFGWILRYFPVHVNTAGTQLINLYFGAVFSGIKDIRNMSIFREAGVFMIYLLLGIIFELFYFDNFKIKRLFVFLITLVTTLSTAGFIVLPLVIIGYYFNKSTLQLRNKVIIICFILFMASSLYYYPELLLRIVSKFDDDSASYASSIARKASIVVNYGIFTQNPFCGSGISAYVDLFKSSSINHYGLPLNASGNSTNTYMSIFATYGILFGSIVILAIFSFSKVFTKAILPQMILFLSFILMFSNEDMRYSLFFNVLVFYGLKYLLSKQRVPASTICI